MTARARTGCQPCRVRHLKCDQGTPVCARCLDSKRECARGYPYRVYKQKFAGNQKWLSTPKEVTFVDETEAWISNQDEDSASEYATPEKDREGEGDPDFSISPSSISHQRPQSESSLSPFSPTYPGMRAGASSSASLPEYLDFSHEILQHESANVLPQIASVVQHEFVQPPYPDPSAITTTASTASTTGTTTTANTTPTVTESYDPMSCFHYEDNFNPNVELELSPATYIDQPIWPLTDPAEALLLRHYVQNLAIWLDLCDPMQHFQIEVPQRAGTCPILLNAIFALSARHLSHIGKYDTFASNHYHQECLQQLIPMLSNAATVADESLFAASIILRVLEEIDLSETDLQSHMLGITVFVSASPSSGSLSSLWQAAFWVGLRQEIFIATIKHSSISISLSHSLIDRSVEPASDFAWANRAVVHYADVLNWAFGERERGTGTGKERWWELMRHSERWNECKPSSFAPIFYRKAQDTPGGVMPEIWHSHACHIIGVQHHKLAQILLLIFDPRIPLVGGARTVGVRAMEAKIKPNLLELCGIGLYNRWTPPGMFTASMGIAVCGDRFTERREQEALLDILIITERDHGRPTSAVQKQMQEAWRWVNA